MGTILRFLSDPPPIFSPMNASGELPSQMDILSHITTRLARLPGRGRQNNFLSSTIMQSNKGAWCQVAGQPARGIYRTTLDLLHYNGNL